MTFLAYFQAVVSLCSNLSFEANRVFLAEAPEDPTRAARDILIVGVLERPRNFLSEKETTSLESVTEKRGGGERLRPKRALVYEWVHLFILEAAERGRDRDLEEKGVKPN